MLFNSLTFLIFFAVVLVVHNLRLPWTVRKINLLVASYLFYAAWNPLFVVLLWASTAFDWWISLQMSRAGGWARKAMLLLSLALNLCLLGYFKYGGFLLETFCSMVRTIGWEFHPAAPDIILPVGISFYTFETMSYTIDVYRGRTRPCRSLLDFALYLAFFPHLVAGPIVRPGELLPQFLQPVWTSARQLGWGLCLLVLGLFEKVVLADSIFAPVADQIYGHSGVVASRDAWIGTLAFAGQIYCDFAGYSICAVGAALALGFVLPDNFRFPYAALGFSDFWTRWHISLSSWLRDYLYIPLGGNRVGPTRTYVNLMLTMLIGGLWHGAAWHYVVWGGLHGLYLVGERLARRALGHLAIWQTAIARASLMLMTFSLICFTWVFFRAPNFMTAFGIAEAMIVPIPGAELLESMQVLKVCLVMMLILAGQWWLRDSSIPEVAARCPRWLRPVILAGMLLAILLCPPGNDRAFIYFQF